MSNKHMVWKTKDGRKIPISELTDVHLLNIHRMLHQQVEDEKHYSGVIGTVWEPRGEMAQDVFEEEHLQVIKQVHIATTLLVSISKEIKRRNLKPLALKDPYKPLPTPIKSTVMDYGVLHEFATGDDSND